MLIYLSHELSYFTTKIHISDSIHLGRFKTKLDINLLINS